MRPSKPGRRAHDTWPLEARLYQSAHLKPLLEKVGFTGAMTPSGGLAADGVIALLTNQIER